MKRCVRSVTVNNVLAAVVLTTSIGCGSRSSPTAPSSSAQEPGATIPPASNIVRSNTVPASNAGVPGVDRFDVAMSLSGIATVALRWPNGDFSLQLYVTRGPCADTTDLVTGGCIILGTTRPGSLPGVITSPVVSGDVATVWVLNPDEEGPQAFTVELAIK
jgi:hypothetical protein